MDIKNITIDLNIKESRRIRGYSDNATVEFELTHPEFKGSLRFEARRNNIKETLERLNIGVKKKELFENVSLEDVAYEIGRAHV